MKNILITGASGNVRKSILNNLVKTTDIKIWKASYSNQLEQDELYFDFNNLERTKNSLKNLDVLFLLRPPQISNTKKYFAPLIQACVVENVKHIIFLSVQGAEKSSIIPHNRIEKMILQSEIPYTFIRPSYFMQNLTTTFKSDIVNKGMISIPAGEAKFLWVDVNDIGKSIASVLINTEIHFNKIHTITGSEYHSFAAVAAMMTTVLGKVVKYESPNLVQFFIKKKRVGVATPYIFVMIMLHYLARFESEPKIFNDFTFITGEQPNLLQNFIIQNKNQWLISREAIPSPKRLGTLTEAHTKE